MKYRVEFLKEKVQLEVEENTTLLEAEIAAGLQPDAPCGGQGTCGKCLVDVVNGKNPGIQKACETHIHENLMVNTLSKEASYAILEDGIHKKTDIAPYASQGLDNQWLVAFDVGTTTVVAYLLNGTTGEQCAIASTLNPQSQYGADVIMRANYVLEHDGKPLSSCIRKAMNQLIEQLCTKEGISTGDISQISFVGNTCMHHLFLELNPDSLVKAPYVPVIVDPVICSAGEYDLKIHPQGVLKVLPNIGGFVGADTVGCLIATDFEHRKKNTLLIDIGTNGEMALTDGKRILACSTAAGPAFEGAKISCGMRGAEGAIDHVWLEDGSVKYHVIGDVEPIGLCGSGLLDSIAVLLKLGIIDDSGRMEGKSYALSDKVVLTQKDVREVQLAKGAIGAGIEIMCRSMGVAMDEIQEVLIAGAFGNYMDPDSACGIGMIPPSLKGRITAIGNAAGEGSKIALLNHEEFLHSGELIKKIEFMELAMEPDFQDVFVDNLEYPV